MKKLILSCIATLLFLAATAQADTQKAVTAYLAVKDALVQGDAATASTQALALQAALGGAKGRDAFSKAVVRLAKQRSLEKQRIAFATLSPLAWEALKAKGDAGTPLYYQYCPMKDAYWISGSEKVENPYYGRQMLDCGKVVDQTH